MESKSKLNWQRMALELVVVFLGVTAGFLLNNWRNQKDERIIEQKYITGFKQDVNSDIEELNGSIKGDSLWIAKALPLMAMVKNNELPADSSIVIMRMIVQISKVTLNTGTYTDITNSGNLNIINDFALRTKLVEYQLSLEGVTFIDNYFYDYFGSFVMPYLFTNYNIIKGEPANSDELDSITFQNVFAGYFSMIQQRYAIYQGIRDGATELRKLLEAYK